MCHVQESMVSEDSLDAALDVVAGPLDAAWVPSSAVWFFLVALNQRPVPSLRRTSSVPGSISSPKEQIRFGILSLTEFLGLSTGVTEHQDVTDSNRTTTFRVMMRPSGFGASLTRTLTASPPGHPGSAHSTTSWVAFDFVAHPESPRCQARILSDQGLDFLESLLGSLPHSMMAMEPFGSLGGTSWRGIL